MKRVDLLSIYSYRLTDTHHCLEPGAQEGSERVSIGEGGFLPPCKLTRVRSRCHRGRGHNAIALSHPVNCGSHICQHPNPP